MVWPGSGWRERLSQGCLGGAVLIFVLARVNAQEAPHQLKARLGLPQADMPQSGASDPRQDREPHVKTLPISLDTVLRLAQDRNGQMAIARQRLEETFAQEDLAAKKWLPDVTVGTGYYRHEGGIQDFTGQLIRSSYGSLFAGLEMRGKLDLREAAYQRIDAERKVWQQKGELSKLTSETLLDAAGAYVDFLAARSSEVISLESEKQFSELIGLAETLAKIDPGLRVEVVRIGSEIQGQQLLTRKLREGASGAAAKLGYLLGLDPASELVPVDGRLAAFELVNCGLQAEALVALALAKGPGVRELEGLLALIEDARAKGAGPGRFVPTLELTMAEGAFGAGPGSQLAWDNRWDLGLHVKWNLTEAVTARARRRLADAQIQQTRLGYQDLRAKLTLGVHEAREACLSGKEQMRLGEQHMRLAEESYRLSNSRLKENIKGRSPSEVLMAIRSLAGARLNYLHAIRDLDKAQLRLFVLVGAHVD
jgi:outer membrane protein TolC